MEKSKIEVSKFKLYLDSRQESAYEFFRRTGIAINTVYKLVRGDPVRIDVAKKVVKVTKNRLTLEDVPVCLYE